MSRDGNRVAWMTVLLVVGGSMAHAHNVTATERSEETLVLIRHGEKPADGLGQLSCQGLNRSLALPGFPTSRFHATDKFHPDASDFC